MVLGCVLTDGCGPYRPVRDHSVARHPRRRRLDSDVQRRVRRHPQTVSGCRAHAAEAPTGGNRPHERVIGRGTDQPGPSDAPQETLFDGIRHRLPGEPRRARFRRVSDVATPRHPFDQKRRSRHSTIVWRSSLRQRERALACGPAAPSARWGGEGDLCVEVGDRPDDGDPPSVSPTLVRTPTLRPQAQQCRGECQPLPSSFCS